MSFFRITLLALSVFGVAFAEASQTPQEKPAPAPSREGVRKLLREGRYPEAESLARALLAKLNPAGANRIKIKRLPIIPKAVILGSEMSKNRYPSPDQGLKFAADQVGQSILLRKRLSRSFLTRLVKLAQATEEALRAGWRVYLFGNGGSAADAQHIAAELQSRLRRDRPSLPVLALTTNTSTLTALANDYSFREIFSRQLEGLVEPGDIVIGITTSGQSANVLAGLRAARKKGAITAALTGSDTQKIKPLADFLLAVPSRDTQRIQEVHILLGHILCDLIEQHLFPKK